MVASGRVQRVLSSGDIRPLPLSDDVFRSRIVPQTHEPRVPQMVLPGPFDEFELPNDHWLQPAAIDHLLRGQAGTPPSGLRFGQIRKWTRGDLERLKPLHQILTQPRSET